MYQRPNNVLHCLCFGPVLRDIVRDIDQAEEEVAYRFKEGYYGGRHIGCVH